MNSFATCLDCEWSGRQSEVTMKWGKRFCPKCKGRNVAVRSASELVQAAAALPQADEDREQTIHDLGRASQ